MKIFRSQEIIERLKKSLSMKSDVELAAALQITKSTLSNWKARNTLDFQLVFSICEHVDLNWLIYGTEYNNDSEEISPAQEKSQMPDSSMMQLINQLKEQAEEIGRLRERVYQLEKEKQAAGSSATNANDTGIANVG